MKYGPDLLVYLRDVSSHGDLVEEHLPANGTSGFIQFGRRRFRRRLPYDLIVFRVDESGLGFPPVRPTDVLVVACHAGVAFHAVWTLEANSFVNLLDVSFERVFGHEDFGTRFASVDLLLACFRFSIGGSVIAFGLKGISR
jgi:hypothetical protein